MLLHLYVQTGEKQEVCYNIETSSLLTELERKLLLQLLTSGLDISKISDKPFLDISNEEGVEIGPLMNFQTAFSTNVVSACENIALDKIRRVEKSIRYLSDDINSIVKKYCDVMTQEVYEKPLTSFTLNREVEPVKTIPLLSKGIEAFDSVKGLSLSKQDKLNYFDYFVNKEKRNPTDVELFDLLNSNSEHSRHGWFNAKQIIDGVEQKNTAFELVKSTLKANPDRSVIGFHDNSSSIRGFGIWDITLTAETHNFPTGIAPYPGAATGTGGRTRDGMATGKGSEIVAGTVGYCVATLNIPGYIMPGENPDFKSPANMVSGLKILIDSSNGASDYGNELGEPVIQGFAYNFDLQVSDDERWGYIKPLLFTSGIGQMRHMHSKKGHAKKGALIVRIGGPAYRIGFGGGAASSMHQGENDSQLDFNAVQRGDAEMANKTYRVITTCNEMEEDTPIISIHDQGAGGPANVLKELVEESGGKIDIRKITCADPTMSVLEIWVCEFQESMGLLIEPEKIKIFEQICLRENVVCEVLGEVTGDGRFVVEDSNDGSTPVDFDLKAILGDHPQATYKDETVDLQLKPLKIPEDLTVIEALRNIFKLLSVGSKGFLVHKVDRSVGGKIAQQQCIGPLQIPLSNVAVTALDHFDIKGAATAQGLKPACMIIDPEAGARLSVAEMMLNMACIPITSTKHLKCSVNWMWAPKKSGEGASLYKSVQTMSEFMPELNIAIDGGKDSLSMATEVDGELVKSPRTVVVSGYAPVEDITKTITPDIKKPGESMLLHIDLSDGKTRLGGSAFAQTLGQIGNKCPDLEDSEKLLDLFNNIQDLIKQDLILSYHDISDGGLITTLCEMAISGNCGMKANIMSYDNKIARAFSEEPGVVIEVLQSDVKKVMTFLPDAYQIAETKRGKVIEVFAGLNSILNERTDIIREWWSETSYQMEKQQGNLCADEERENTMELKNPEYKLTFEPNVTNSYYLENSKKYKVAVVRAEGSNGDKEMKSALKLAGFDPIDVPMYDLINGDDDFLDDFRGMVFVGGFSNADYPEAAKGWAMTIMNNPKLQKMFNDFKYRDNTWSFGTCNGCQMLALLGWTSTSCFTVPENRPRFIKNKSGKFESRYTTVKIPKSNSIMLNGMEGSVLPIWSNHGEGQIFADDKLLKKIKSRGNVPLLYVDNHGNETQKYPFNPNGSPLAIAGLCSDDGRHTIIMPHPERLFQTWQFAYLPEEMQKLKASPWLKVFQNAREWCEK